jgi:hypothetical protein
MNKIKPAFYSLCFAILMLLPDEFSKFRVRYYNKKGCKIDKNEAISPVVRIRGRFEMGKREFYCSISVQNFGVFIGKKVMIAHNIVIGAFNYGF